jgi:hypothetical protein
VVGRSDADDTGGVFSMAEAAAAVETAAAPSGPEPWFPPLAAIDEDGCVSGAVVAAAMSEASLTAPPV